jgi:4-amino-4-deoxy-L-arabinose transferase-like glycosyltransferase
MKRISLIVLLALSAALLLTGIGNQYLWQDEAETAMLANNVLKYGYPKAYDGTNLITPRIRTGYGPGHSWLYHPWMQFYITAASFKLFGANTFSARLPFALLGIVNIFLAYFLARRFIEDDTVARWAAFLLAVSVPFILLMRQCRYYAPVVFFVLLAVLFYLRFLSGRKTRDLVVSALSMIGIAYTVHGIFIPVFAAIGADYLLFERKKETFLRVFIAGAVVCLFSLPWFVFSNSAAHEAVINLKRLKKNIEFDFRMINKYIFPAAFFAAVYVARGILLRRFTVMLSDAEYKFVRFLLMLTAFSIAVLAFAEERNFRYLVFLMPFYCIATALILKRLFAFSKRTFASFVILFVLTGFFNSGYPTCYFPKYLYEITHDYDGPVEGIVNFLRANAKPGDEVKIAYDDLGVMFYTGLKVDNFLVYDAAHMPDWIVFRRDWKEDLESPYFKDVRDRYRQYVLGYPDIAWENRPDDMGYHKFWTDTKAPRVIIFGKK